MLPIEWEALCSAERLALKTAGDVSPLSFTSLWFNVTQGDAFQSNCAEEIIYEQKFTGAAADMLNPNIIARDLGLADKKDLQSTDGSMTPKTVDAALVSALVDKLEG